MRKKKGGWSSRLATFTLTKQILIYKFTPVIKDLE